MDSLRDSNQFYNYQSNLVAVEKEVIHICNIEQSVIKALKKSSEITAQLILCFTDKSFVIINKIAVPKLP